MNGVIALLRRLNLRYLTTHVRRTALTTAGIAAGVALVFSISVINATLLGSFRTSMRELGGAAEIEVAAADPSGLPERAVRTVGAVEGVEQAVPVVRVMTRATAGPEVQPRVMVMGVTPEFAGLFPRSLGALAQLDISGGFGARGSGVLLASGIADGLGVGVGDLVQVETPRGPRRITVSGRISGRALAVLNQARVGVMLLPAAQEVFDKRGRIDSIYVVTEPDMPVARVEQAIEQRLQGAGLVGAPGERGRGLERIFEGLATLLAMGGAVGLFVALFVVYNTMSMSLAERRRELSMALAFGATRREVAGAFLAEAAVVGAVASVIGVLGGLGLARLLIEQTAGGYDILPVAARGSIVVARGHVLLAAVSGFLVSILGALVPARRVFEVAPIESLRPEAAYEWGKTASFGLGRRAAAVAAVAGIGGAVALFVAYIFRSEQRWMPLVGVVSGMTGITFLLPRIVPVAVRILRPILVKLFATPGRLSSDALTKNPGRTTFTVAALVLTLGMVVGVGSALASYESEVEGKATALIGAPLYVAARSYTGLTSDQPLPLALQRDLQAVPGVRYVYPLRFSLLTLGDQQALMYAVPVEEVLEKGATTRLSALTEDPEAFVRGLSGGAIAVSRTTAERRGLEVGEHLELPTPAGGRRFEVAAIFDDLLEFDSIYIDHATYLDVWQERKADEFGLLLDEGAAIGDVKRRVESLIEDERVPANVFTKEELIGRILDIIEGTFSLGRGIQLAALVIAALTIANTMFITVLERRWEMGLQRALGMSDAQLRRVVLLEASAIGVIGGVGGVILGSISGWLMTVAMQAQFAWRITFAPPISLFVLAVGVGTVLAALAGLVPSRLAGRASIIESLRFD